jgi:hypothetical protein
VHRFVRGISRLLVRGTGKTRDDEGLSAICPILGAESLDEDLEGGAAVGVRDARELHIGGLVDGHQKPLFDEPVDLPGGLQEGIILPYSYGVLSLD